jgi:hypothetical protein
VAVEEGGLLRSSTAITTSPALTAGIAGSIRT